uniref:pyruvate decarboxylase n=1 Tax=Oryza rufipogon TaxID=4529 RepID=A0A0E0PNS2_ORYRU
MVGGPKIRVAKAKKAFAGIAESSGYPFAVMPSAKGLVPEHHPRFIGTYWGAVSTTFCAEIVESADAYLFAGPIFNDYSSVGYSLLLKREKAVIVQPDRVVVGNGPAFGCILMTEFLDALAKRLDRNTTAYEFQMQYGSIGWSVGATLGYAQAAKDKRVISCIGDGSFQMTAQDVSTMLRCGQKSIIFLINNGGYTIEVEIHDGPYNVIKNWDYTGLIDAIHNSDGNCWTKKVRTEEELIEAIATATGAKKDCLCFIEIIVHKDDTSKELLEWGSRVSAANSRPPNPQ